MRQKFEGKLTSYAYVLFKGGRIHTEIIERDGVEYLKLYIVKGHDDKVILEKSVDELMI